MSKAAPVQLDPNAVNRQSAVNLQTIGKEKLNRVQTLRDELNRYYTENRTRQEANQMGLPYVDLYGYPVNINHLTKIPKEQAERAKIGIIGLRDNLVYLATPHPGYPGQQEIIQRLQAEDREVVIHYCSEESLTKLLEKYNFAINYQGFSDDIRLTEEQIHGSGKVDFDYVVQRCRQISISEILEKILIGALQNDASDIHFEPEKNRYVLRYRIDGVLHTFAEFPPEMIEKIENRVKVVAKLKINIGNQAQDGRFSFVAGNREIDMRVSLLPSNYGYSIVMRLLGTGSVNLTLEDLGFIGNAKTRVNQSVFKTTGMILTTGPTGSGKTTSLYTFLRTLNDGQNKIITLEDPIEYKLEGISQTQIDHEAGYNFASGLRSILRQDPDVVMVGEIRDKETADVAVQASLTGHKVLSTIHTNDAAGAIPRLMEMGMKGFLLADSLSMIVGQRLVRRTCPHCQVEEVLDDNAKQFVQKVVSELPANHGVENLPHELRFYKGQGCPKCNNLGYKGRIGVYEILTITDSVRELLGQQTISFLDVRRAAAKDGMVTMQQDAVLKALLRITDIREVMRVVG
jgi:type IV pilus assembly protein PilB